MVHIIFGCGNYEYKHIYICRHVEFRIHIYLADVDILIDFQYAAHPQREPHLFVIRARSYTIQENCGRYTNMSGPNGTHLPKAPLAFLSYCYCVIQDAKLYKFLLK